MMELKTPPECECGNGFMILRKAGDYATRPGHYYYVCPAELKHRNKFIWYDEFHGTSKKTSEEQTYKSDSNSTHLGDRSCQSFTNQSMHSFHRQHASPSKQAPPSGTNYGTDMDYGMSSRSYDLPSRGMKIQPYKRDHLCCCFGFICALVCVIFFLVLVLVWKF